MSVVYQTCVTGLKCLIPKPAGGGSVYTIVHTHLLVYSVLCIVRTSSKHLHLNAATLLLTLTFTLSMVALSLFSSLGSSHLRSALSLTSCLCTLVSWSRLFSRKLIFCFWATDPPRMSSSSPAADWRTKRNLTVMLAA
ncbi:hypothetical protein E2C01_025387 [Portunus trituberculatus]|uniref:Uncharacterized protein n=1 Tax=Portunus trituberculatus TaxID=210409 RepID=A0A5B7EGB4_PORTR|nr:hypothetical protein [Portunus trituberculatus]